MKRVSLFVLLCFVLCVFSGVPARVHAVTWWDTDWNYKIKLTVDQTKVDADLTDFPVLVYLNSSRINWAHVQDDLDDLRFVDSTETTVLKAELENYTLNNEAWIWVKITTIDDTVDTDFYLYYGNSVCSSYWNPEDVWVSSAVMVQHMVDNPDSSHIMDSTSYSNDGTKKGVNEPIETASGKIDSAQSFDGDNDNISIPNSATLHFAGSFTVMAWMKLTAYNPEECWIVSDYAGAYRGYILRIGPSGYLYFLVGRLSDTITTQVASSQPLALDTWYQIVGLYDGIKPIVYVNAVVTVGDNFSPIEAETGITYLGLTWYGELNYNGIIDEVHIYNTAKSAAWIKADYNSGADTLLSYGAELANSFLTVYYNSGISKLYINGTLATNGTVVTTFVDKNVNATATTKPKYVFLKHLLGLTQTSATPTYIFNMTASNTLWAYAIASETAGASSGALIFTALLALIILIPFLWWRRRK